VQGKLRKASEGKDILNYFFGKQLHKLFLMSVPFHYKSAPGEGPGLQAFHFNQV